jgi:hypothetical protein
MRRLPLPLALALRLHLYLCKSAVLLLSSAIRKLLRL